MSSVRDELTPKYRGIYNKAKTGRSPKAAIQVHCLRCMVSKTKDIRDCTNVDCEFYQYRPYQETPHRFVKRRTQQNLNRTDKGQIKPAGKKSAGPVQKDIIIKEPPSGPLRLKITLEPEKA